MTSRIQKTKSKPSLNDPAEGSKRAKTIAKPTPTPKRTAPHGKNSAFWSDDKLIYFIEDRAKEANAHSKKAGEGSVMALNLYAAIGNELLDQKALGKFKKPRMSIKNFCNTNLAGIIGDTNPYAMCGLCMTFAKPGKGNKPGLWETFMDHVEKMEMAGTPVGPMGINAAMSLARKLMRGETPTSEKPKPSRVDRLAEAERRLASYQQLATDMLLVVPPSSLEEFKARIVELDSPTDSAATDAADDQSDDTIVESDDEKKLAAD